MRRRIALKRLSESDLTLFEHHFRHTSGTKQKAFNLDRAVFIDILYPDLPERLSRDIARDRVSLDLSIYGPGKAGLHNLQRKVLKQQKNWRLNGELIYAPPEDLTRYEALRKDDFAIFDFSEDPEPRAARLYLIAAGVAADASLHAVLHTRYAPALSHRKSMEVIDPEDMGEMIGALNLVEGHAVLDLVDGVSLEDAVKGGAAGTRHLRRRRGSRGVSRTEFERARKAAEQSGRQGEEILNAWLETECNEGRLPGFAWDADQNAISPYDFSIREGDRVVRVLDAKSTTGDFGNAIHVSIAELDEMVNGAAPYDLYRLYQVSESFARLRVAQDMSGFASTILEGFQNLPNGVSVDSVSINPRTLQFGEEMEIDLREEAESLGSSDFFDE